MEEAFALAEDGTRLYVRQRRGASRTTVVLCDGIVCDGFIYKYLWDDVAHPFSVAHWHYRGHGRSALPVDPERIAVGDFARDLTSVRQHLGDPPVVLVGHSYGAQVCLEAYRQRPQGVKALVLMCGTFGRVTHTFKGSDLLASVLPKLIDFVVGHPKLARALWSRVPPRVALRVAVMTGEIDGSAIRVEDIEPYFAHVAHVDFPMFLRMLQLAGEHSAEDLLPEIRVPTLVIAGDRDTFTPAELSETMSHLIPHSELLVVPGGTHVTPLEHHELIDMRIAKFLEDHGVR
ncbi:MAG: alpha/beta hydrolase [Myxococcales bacterium]|nr:alpha/beta hydrolase [Myxococcales bacterium]